MLLNVARRIFARCQKSNQTHNMKQFSFFVLLLGFIFTVGGCKKIEPTETSSDTFPTVGTLTLNSNVIKLDNPSNSALVAIDTNSLSFSSATSQLNIAKQGDILIGVCL
jgi:hypothetical protein